MRKFLKATLLLGAAAVACYASVAQAAVTISTGATKGIACASGVCTASAATAILNVTDLTKLLAAGNVQVVPGTKAQDIVVASPLSWVSTKRLTLNATRSIKFTQPTTITGHGALTLTINGIGTLSFTGKGNVNFWDTTSSLVINGTPYKLVNDIATLATDVAANTNGHFALAKSYDAKLDGTYKAAPIPVLDGAFEGLGNSISNLKIALKTPTALDPFWMGEAGLFGTVSAPGSIENIAVLNAHVSAGDLMNAGLLVGELYGTVANSRSSGSAQVGNGIFEGTGNVYASDAGGLVGAMLGSTAAVLNSTSTATATGGNSAYAGGLIGVAYNGGFIFDSSASGNVTVGNRIFGTNQGAGAGGLVGVAFDTTGSTVIDGDHASGKVVGGTGQDEIGGLVGSDGGAVLIEFSYATGSVSVGAGADTLHPPCAGGLVGSDLPVGTATDTITQSYATGAVTGAPTTLVGGFAGYSTGTISDSYATGAVSVTASGVVTGLGGFIGYLDTAGSVSTSYSTGSVENISGFTDDWAGGFVGATGGALASDYWDTNTSGLSHGEGNVASVAGVTGVTSTTLQSAVPTGFSALIWKESGAVNSGFPYLIAIPPV